MASGNCELGYTGILCNVCDSNYGKTTSVKCE